MLVLTRPFVLALGRMRRFAAVLTLAVIVPALAGSARAETPPPQGVVNINSASAEELMLLPRIGEGKAKRIVEHRMKTPFKNVNEIARVKGIGLKTLRLLKPYIRIDGPTTLTSEVRGVEVEGADAPTPKPASKALPALGTAPR